MVLARQKLAASFPACIAMNSSVRAANGNGVRVYDLTGETTTVMLPSGMVSAPTSVFRDFKMMFRGSADGVVRDIENYREAVKLP